MRKRRRSPSPIPPHTPSTWLFCMAKSRHSSLISQRKHIALHMISRVALPTSCLPSSTGEKNNSGAAAQGGLYGSSTYFPRLVSRGSTGLSPFCRIKAGIDARPYVLPLAIDAPQRFVHII